MWAVWAARCCSRFATCNVNVATCPCSCWKRRSPSHDSEHYPYVLVKFPRPTTEVLIEGVRHDVKTRILGRNNDVVMNGLSSKIGLHIFAQRNFRRKICWPNCFYSTIFLYSSAKNFAQQALHAELFSMKFYRPKHKAKKCHFAQLISFI